VPLKLGHRKGSPHYYLRGTVRGQSIFETTGTNDQVAADAIRIKRENELLQRSVFGPAATVTFAEAATSYLEDGAGEARFLGKYDQETGEWSLLIGHFFTTPIAKIGQAEIDTAAQQLYPTAKAATRKRQVYIPMSAVLRHAARKGWGAPPMLKHPKVKKSETRYSSVDRLNKLLPYCSAKLRRLVVFLPYTGARISECLRVDWERDIDLFRRTVTLRRTKNGKPRTVHLADPVLIELTKVLEADRKGQVFKWKKRGAVYKPLKRACEKAGVDYLPTHQQGRHTFAAWLRIDGKRDLVGLKADGGWDSIQSVMRYEHLVPGESADAVNRLPHIQNPCSVKAKGNKPLKRKGNSRR
jgi:integrase